MYITRFELLWNLAAQAREDGDKTQAKILFEQALEALGLTVEDCMSGRYQVDRRQPALPLASRFAKRDDHFMD